MQKYNGWANYETWNVGLWLGNDEKLYTIAKNYKGDYKTLVAALSLRGIHSTPDGVGYDSAKVDVKALNSFLNDIQ